MDTINTQNIDTNSVDKKKKHFIPKLIAILTSAFSIIGVGTSLLIKNQFKSALAVEYDDENYTITLSVNELNNYSFNNFNDALVQYGSNALDQDITYDDIVLHIDDSDMYDNDHYYLIFNNDENDDYNLLVLFNGTYNENSNFRTTSDNKFRIFFEYALTTEETNFIYDLKIELTESEYYSAFKSAIELDIQSNQPYDNNTFLQDIVELLVGGIVAFGGGFATGLNNLVSALAIQNGAMSPFMAVVLCFGGLALAFGLSRWVVNLISSLGQRNR